ncbi:MAG: divalent-cation tolerance protein CutA [Pseudomonadota bacterium]
MQKDTRAVIVFSTIDSEDRAAEVARALVESSLAACVNIVPRIRSVYKWKGDLCDDAESLMIIKTRRSLLEKLKQKIASMHPYDVPEIVAFDIADGHDPYLKWLLDSTLGS